MKTLTIKWHFLLQIGKKFSSFFLHEMLKPLKLVDVQRLKPYQLISGDESNFLGSVHFSVSEDLRTDVILQKQSLETVKLVIQVEHCGIAKIW